MYVAMLTCDSYDDQYTYPIGVYRDFADACKLSLNYMFSLAAEKKPYAWPMVLTIKFIAVDADPSGNFEENRDLGMMVNYTCNDWNYISHWTNV